MKKIYLVVIVGLVLFIIVGVVYYIRINQSINKVSKLSLLPAENFVVQKGQRSDCQTFKYGGTPGSETEMNCDYQITYKTGVIIRMVRILGVESQGINRFVVVERKVEDKWIVEKYFIGNVDGQLKRMVRYAKTNIFPYTGEYTDKLLNTEETYRLFESSKDQEVLMHMRETDEVRIGLDDYMSPSTIIFYLK